MSAPLPPSLAADASPSGDGRTDPVGFPLPDFEPRPLPQRRSLTGSYCKLEPLSPSAHSEQLFAAFSGEDQERDWTYLNYGPFPDVDELTSWAETVAAHDDLWFFTVIDLATARAVGVLALMRVDRVAGCIEVGHIHFAKHAQRGRISTEAITLLLRYVFEDLAYRRVEWKCDSLNQRSRSAAMRLGFTFEGVFRQHMVYRGRNRDTAWFSLLDQEWPLRRRAFDRWLAPSNFDARGEQRSTLAACASTTGVAK